jgi:hypothetical protein
MLNTAVAVLLAVILMIHWFPDTVPGHDDHPAKLLPADGEAVRVTDVP